MSTLEEIEVQVAELKKKMEKMEKTIDRINSIMVVDSGKLAKVKEKEEADKKMAEGMRVSIDDMDI
ncbi:hypothetical protein CL630_01385 [bacterium]|nr:hypothetical protein [bacterium]|tara:strand:- start:18009 stop:18206 length:198 start_codon:yes stop_codon:yes gene_type:complete